ncbi:hypothetical protein [Chroococcidiopsis sp.]|uniref:hypothetical protein n=1 Tax=Chroococcidiopsis sp. TaxID=3088168 RepID=UPI003F2EF80A
MKNRQEEEDNNRVPSRYDDYYADAYTDEDLEGLEELDFDTIVAKLESGFKPGDEDHDFG